MDGQRFDGLVKTLSDPSSRRRVLKGLGAAVAAGGFAAAGRQAVDAAPRTCTTCVCGTGRPCNPKSTSCTEARGFPAQQECAAACERKGQRLCSLGNSFHCPRGCPA